MKKKAKSSRSVNSRKKGRIVGRFVHSEKMSAGSVPGTLMHTGERKTEEVITRFIDYDETDLREGRFTEVKECLPFSTSSSVTWIDVIGLHDVKQVGEIGEVFKLHPLMLEDIVSPGQRPKIEVYDGSIFIVLKMLRYLEEEKTIDIDQVSLVIGKNFVITFQEKPWDVLESLRDRLRHSKGRIRSRGADYLAYAIIDAIVDGYFAVLEEIGNEIEVVEDLVVKVVSPSIMQEIHGLKREVLVLRRSVWPLREVLGAFYRDESDLIEDQTRMYLRDVYDHSIQVIDTIETFRDLLSGTMDLYLSSISNRMNEVMKVLTIIATIFIPLTFVAGLYGMNFKHMPELQFPWAYPAVLLLMASVGGGMILYFRKKRWI